MKVIFFITGVGGPMYYQANTKEIKYGHKYALPKVKPKVSCLTIVNIKD